MTYYEILGLQKTTSDDEIKRAYLKMAKQHHPDNNPQNRHIATKRFHEIREAYEHIKTRERRAVYNQKIRLSAQNDNQSRGRKTPKTQKNETLFSSLFDVILGAKK